MLNEKELKKKYKPPVKLDKIGKKEWFRVWAVLEKENKAEVNDPFVVELIAHSYQVYTQLDKLASEDGFIVEYTNKAGATNPTKHPAISELPKYAAVMMKGLSELGLTGASRKKLQEQMGKGPDDGFDDF
ncbi:phage terminase small subunit P27 family [Fictibacillus aquaticus]|uniref:Terminase n=1 Tax=Fictibacillus aquaticus TaxID=2021314 RepID=A0A235F9N5_9BACL|nr:phage terminase small subunit P27 family [Fictibacillus aquaticus]OYD57879.1 terminase [Fictibacillus aquaticus]